MCRNTHCNNDKKFRFEKISNVQFFITSTVPRTKVINDGVLQHTFQFQYHKSSLKKENLKMQKKSSHKTCRTRYFQCSAKRFVMKKLERSTLACFSKQKVVIKGVASTLAHTFIEVPEKIHFTLKKNLKVQIRLAATHSFIILNHIFSHNSAVRATFNKHFF